MSSKFVSLAILVVVVAVVFLLLFCFRDVAARVHEEMAANLQHTTCFGGDADVCIADVTPRNLP